MVLGKNRKVLLAFSGRFSIIYDMFDPGILIFIFKTLSLLQQEILKPIFGPQTSIFHIHVYESPAKISNVPPIFRRSSQEFKRPAKISNAQPAFFG